MLDRLQINSNAQYFTIKRKLSKNLINQCLKKASENSTGRKTEEVRHTLVYGGESFKISYCVFKTEKKPSFLLTGLERDILHGFALLIEIDNFLILSRSGGQDFSDLLENNVKLIDAKVLQNSFIESGTHFEKIAAQSISTSKSLIQKVTYEDPNLQHSLPLFGTSQKIVKNVRHKTGGKRFSTNTNKSRFNILGQKSLVADFCLTAHEAHQRFENYKEKDNFLSNFASLLTFSDYSSKIIPKEILLLTSDLIQFIEDNEFQTPKVYYQKLNNRKIYLQQNLLEIIDQYADELEIIPKKEKGVKHYYLNNKFDSSLELVATENKFKLKSKKFKNVFVEFDENTTINFQKYINEAQCFIVTFDKSDIRYSVGQLCQDSKLLGRISNFLQIFIPDKKLNTVTSEKGKYNKKSTSFETTSIFNYTENTYNSTVDDLILDDFGFESADYIGVKKNKAIRLFHCKYSKKIFSASAFQDVVGQALKNLSFFYQTSEIDKKTTLWNDKYLKTKINRLRKGDQSKFIDNIKQTLSSANYDQEVHIVINYISLKTLTEELEKLKNNKNPKRQTNQILWLLSSLKNSCEERGIKVFIRCKE